MFEWQDFVSKYAYARKCKHSCQMRKKEYFVERKQIISKNCNNENYILYALVIQSGQVARVLFVLELVKRVY